MSQIWMSRSTHELVCHSFYRFISHTWMRHLTHRSESRPAYEASHLRLLPFVWVMSHTWMCHVTHMNVSCHTHVWVMSHTWTSHVTRMNESCQIRIHMRMIPHDFKIQIKTSIYSFRMRPRSRFSFSFSLPASFADAPLVAPTVAAGRARVFVAHLFLPNVSKMILYV